MSKWIITGISGCGRIEFLDELKKHCEQYRKRVNVYDVGKMIHNECLRLKIPFKDDRILDIDKTTLKVVRVSVLKDVEIEILKNQDVDLHLIGSHATFRWKQRILPGISYQDLIRINPDGFINIVDNVEEIEKTNKKNPKWDEFSLSNLEETQEWMMEEEFITEVLSDVLNKPMYIVARDHTIENFSDLLLSTKKKIYLSYPITAVQEENPEMLKKVQGTILKELEELFVVFDPLSVKDMSLAEKKLDIIIGENIENGISLKAKEIIKKRTIERDFQFIDQSDAVVVLYLTDKLSPGVLAEIYYAHRNQKPVFMVFPGKKSPFIEDATTFIEETFEELIPKLKEFADSKITCT